MPRNTKGHQTGTPVPGGSICARQHHTDTAARYRKVSGLHFVIFGIVYIWLNEQHRRQELEITSQKIRCLRKDIHEVYVKMVDLSLIGETVLDWNEEDMNIYHKKRLEVDSLLSLFKSSYRSERIDSVCRLLAEKENLLNKIMLTVMHELRTPLTAINGYGNFWHRLKMRTKE